MFDRFRIPAVLAVLFVGAAAVTTGAVAQDKNKTDAKAATIPKDNTAATAKNTAAPAQSIPDGAALNILIRRTLLTVNDANLSGNYSVLRELAAPGFQQVNDAKKLAEIFANLRNSKIDFAPIVYFDPMLTRKPELTKEGRVRLTGFVPTQPQQVNFDMLFENVSGRWLLYDIAVNTSPAKTAAAAAKSPAAEPAKAPAAAAPAKK